jgi:predicted Zn-dependent peptidase
MEKKYILEDELVIKEELSNGLTVYLHPKKNFIQTFASLQVNFGGRDFKYKINDITEELPQGTAHFLEHMLFENNGSNLSDIFIKNNADINAYTSRRVTSYYFSCQDNFSMLLSKLLDNFCDYSFNDKSISKERSIIAQELAMNDDSLAVKAYKSLLKLMYKDPLIYEDIGGSQTSIKKINSSILQQAVSHFYHPRNMTLVITGNFEIDQVLQLLRSHQFVKKVWHPYKEVKREVDYQGSKKHTFKKVDKSFDTNTIEIGVKIPENLLKDPKFNHVLYATPFMGMLFGPSSKFYQVLKKKNLNNFTFSIGPVIEDDYGFFNISIETKKPKQFVKIITELLLSVPDLSIDSKIFLAYKRSDIGRSIKIFDDVKYSHSLLKKMLINNIDVYSFIEKSKQISLVDLQYYQEIFKKENIFLVEYLQKY